MIRKLHKDDLEKVLQIWLEVNTETHYFISEAYWRKQLDAVKEILPRSEVYVYEKKGEILGFAGLMGNQIAGLFVSAPWRSRGDREGIDGLYQGNQKRPILACVSKEPTGCRFLSEREFHGGV